MKIFVINGGRIEEVWFKAIKTCVEFGHQYKIDKGEYEGQYRREFDYVTLNIKTPWIRPLACQSQTITPTTDENIESYFLNYLMDPDFHSEEEFEKNAYKYSTWIAPLWQSCCDDLLIGMGGCNQACISIGDIFSGQLYTRKRLPSGDIKFEFTGQIERFKNPPCFRILQMRIRYGRLHFLIYFRSWDLCSGLPENLGGIERLKETCLDYINLSLSDRNIPLLQNGSIIASSGGLHLYDHYFQIAEEYVGTESSALEIPGVYMTE